MSAFSKAPLPFLATAVFGMPVKFEVEPPVPAIVFSTHCGQAPLLGSGPVFIPGKCYLRQDGPQAGKQSSSFTCNGATPTRKVFQTGDCSGSSSDMASKACLGFTNMSCAPPSAGSTYVTMYMNLSAMSETTCAVDAAETRPVDDTCMVLSVFSGSKLAYNKSCGGIRMTTETCASARTVFHWTGTSGACAAITQGGAGDASICSTAGAVTTTKKAEAGNLGSVTNPTTTNPTTTKAGATPKRNSSSNGSSNNAVKTFAVPSFVGNALVASLVLGVVVPIAK